MAVIPFPSRTSGRPSPAGSTSITAARAGCRRLTRSARRCATPPKPGVEAEPTPTSPPRSAPSARILILLRATESVPIMLIAVALLREHIPVLVGSAMAVAVAGVLLVVYGPGAAGARCGDRPDAVGHR